MLRHRMFLVSLLLAVVAAAPAALAAEAKGKDTDADGILDAHEKALGMPIETKNVLKVIAESPPVPEKRKTDKYDATKDLLSLEYCHVGGDRHVWRVTLVEPFRPKDSVLHFYIDADANRETGRKGVGCEYMVTTAGGGVYTNQYSTDGKLSRGPKQSLVVVGDSVLVSHDLKISRDAKGLRYSIRVSCHTIPPKGERVPAMSDGMTVVVKEWPVTKGPVPERPKK